MITKSISSLIGILDRILFRIVPGVCFIAYAFQLVGDLDTQLRALEQTGLISVMYLLAIPFFASIFWWIVVPSAFESGQEKTKENAQTLIINICLIAINLGSLIFFSQSQSYWKYFSDVGILLYVSIFLADVFFIIQTALKEIFSVHDDKLFLSKKSLFALAVYFLVCLLFPALFIIYKFFGALFLAGVSQLVFISVIASFVVKVVSRYLNQQTSGKIV